MDKYVFYVEVYRPAYPDKGIYYRVHSAKQYCKDILSPCLTALWRVGSVKTKQEALAVLLEYAAGPKGQDVQLLMPNDEE